MEDNVMDIIMKDEGGVMNGRMKYDGGTFISSGEKERCVNEGAYGG